MTSKNSTIVRFVRTEAVLRRVGLKIAAALAPERTERYAADLFRRPVRVTPPGAPSVPLYAGKPFTIDAPSGALQCA